MSRKATGGLLFGAGIGFGIAWFLKMLGNGDQERIIILKTGAKGTLCMKKPDDVEVRKGKKLTWWIVNQSEWDVEVSLRNWRDADGQPKAPAVDPSPDQKDPDEPPQDDLSRMVPQGKVRKIQSRARRPALLFEEVYYDVYLNGSLGADPIVKLVL